ncbi:MAG: sodium:calcium antiporter [Opitutales bacterium]
MDEAIHTLFNGLSMPVLFLALTISLIVLAKGAGILVEEAVALSLRLRIPPVVIGATVVSLGTTLPEASISVAAALQGHSDLALGNAVGSIICDTGLILGLGAIIRPLPVDPRVVNGQGWIQVGAALLLVVFCLPFGNLGSLFTEGGVLPQWGGFLFVILLVVYLYGTLRMTRDLSIQEPFPHDEDEVAASPWKIGGKLLIGLMLVVAASKTTIPSAEIIALRSGVPSGIIAASVVAFGTSLPELVTVVTSVLKGRGDIAIGNVIGADILNVLFVAGVSAAASPAGLVAGPPFFITLFPFMLVLLFVFRLGVLGQRKQLGRGYGVLLVVLYGAFLWANYL